MRCMPWSRDRLIPLHDPVAIAGRLLPRPVPGAFPEAEQRTQPGEVTSTIVEAMAREEAKARAGARVASRPAKATTL